MLRSRDESLGVGDDRRIVRRDAGIVAVLDQRVHALHVVRVDLALVRKGDRRRLLVRALADAHAALGLDRALDVGPGAVEIALQHDADVVLVRRIQPVVEQRERAIGVRARLHVEPHERVVLLRAVEHVVHDRDAQLLGDVQSHRRELERDVRVELLLVNPVEDRRGTRCRSRALRARW